MKLAMSVAVLVLFLSGCVSSSDPAIVLPTIVNYDQDFRDDFSSELSRICGQPEEGVVDPYPKTCTFIRDQLELRRQLKEMKK